MPLKVWPSAAEAPAPATESARGSQPAATKQAMKTPNARPMSYAEPQQKKRLPVPLVPEVHSGAALEQAFSFRLKETLERRLAPVGAARHVFERAGEVEGPHIRVDAEHLPAARIEEHERWHVAD